MKKEYISPRTENMQFESNLALLVSSISVVTDGTFYNDLPDIDEDL